MGSHVIYAIFDQCICNDAIVINYIECQFYFCSFRCQCQYTKVCAHSVVRVTCYTAYQVDTCSLRSDFTEFFECDFHIAQHVCIIFQLVQEVYYYGDGFRIQSQSFQFSCDFISLIDDFVSRDACCVSRRHDLFQICIDSGWEVDVSCSANCSDSVFDEITFEVDTCNHRDVSSGIAFNVFFYYNTGIFLVFFEGHCTVFNCQSCLCRSNCHCTDVHSVHTCFFVSISCDYRVSTCISWRCSAVVCYEVAIVNDVVSINTNVFNCQVVCSQTNAVHVFCNNAHIFWSVVICEFSRITVCEFNSYCLRYYCKCTDNRICIVHCITKVLDVSNLSVSTVADILRISSSLNYSFTVFINTHVNVHQFFCCFFFCSRFCNRYNFCA